MMSANDEMNDAAELDLSEDESLPWLESDEEDEDEGAVDTARIIGFAAILLVVLAALIGTIWFVTNTGGDPELVADGSTIEAPEGPYKERPDDPDG
ncbi:MAG: SPOR domain-containing protein, partial [Pseudomonadota bacterium]